MACSDCLCASAMERSASLRAEVRVFSASVRAEAMACSACSWAALSIRSDCSRASALNFSVSCFASVRILLMSSCARVFCALASSSASLSICPIRSLISSYAGLSPAAWRAEESSSLSRSISSSERDNCSSRSRVWLRERATNSST